MTGLNHRTLTLLPLLLLFLPLFCLFYGFHGASSFSRPATPLNTAFKSTSIHPEALWKRSSLPKVLCYVCEQVCVQCSHHQRSGLGVFLSLCQARWDIPAWYKDAAFPINSVHWLKKAEMISGAVLNKPFREIWVLGCSCWYTFLLQLFFL